MKQRPLHTLCFPSGTLEVPVSSSPSGMMKDFRQYGGATSAGDNGALNLYHEGSFRVVEFQRYCVVIDKRLCDTNAEAYQAVKEFWPGLGRVR